MEEKKTCPYCGGEILAVAIKCKHCGEWLNKPEESIVCPICGEENPKGTIKCIHCHEAIIQESPLSAGTKSEANVTDIAHFLSYKSALPLSILLYALVCYIGGYAAAVYNMLTSRNYDLMGVLPYTSLFGIGLVLWIGFAYSQKFTDATKTCATLRAWLALEVGYIWWAFALVLDRVFNTLGLYSSFGDWYDDWLQVSYAMMLILGLALWLVLKFGKKLSLDAMIKLFVLFNIAAVILTTMAVIIELSRLYSGFYL